jgi:hypothetical protein
MFAAGGPKSEMESYFLFFPPFGEPGSTPSYVCLPSARGGWWRLFNYPVLVGLIWTTRNVQEEMAKALAEFKFRHLGKHFYGTKRLCEIPLCKILYFVRCTGLLAE